MTASADALNIAHTAYPDAHGQQASILLQRARLQRAAHDDTAALSSIEAARALNAPVEALSSGERAALLTH
jgi:hypothetical protein